MPVQVASRVSETVVAVVVAVPVAPSRPGWRTAADKTVAAAVADSTPDSDKAAPDPAADMVVAAVDMVVADTAVEPAGMARYKAPAAAADIVAARPGKAVNMVGTAVAADKLDAAMSTVDPVVDRRGRESGEDTAALAQVGALLLAEQLPRAWSWRPY